MFFNNCMLLCRDSIMSLSSLSACCFQRKSNLDVTSTNLPWYVTITKNTNINVSICAERGIVTLKPRKPQLHRYCVSMNMKLIKSRGDLRILLLVGNREEVLADYKNQHRVNGNDDRGKSRLHQIIQFQRRGQRYEA